MSVVRVIVVVALCVLAAGCARTWDNYLPDDPGVAASPAHGVPPPYGATAVPYSYEYTEGYKVGAGDQLAIKVFGQEELGGEYVVDGAGNISMPLIETVRVAELTVPQIARSIETRLRQRYLRDPSVSVQVLSQRPFFIVGEVQNPGSYPYLNGMTVQNAIALGGGYTPRANQGEVLVTRRSSSGTHSVTVPVTMPLYPGDIVYVRERWF